MSKFLNWLDSLLCLIGHDWESKESEEDYLDGAYRFKGKLVCRR